MFCLRKNKMFRTDLSLYNVVYSIHEYNNKYATSLSVLLVTGYISMQISIYLTEMKHKLLMRHKSVIVNRTSSISFCNELNMCNIMSLLDSSFNMEFSASEFWIYNDELLFYAHYKSVIVVRILHNIHLCIDVVLCLLTMIFNDVTKLMILHHALCVTLHRATK